MSFLKSTSLGNILQGVGVVIALVAGIVAWNQSIRPKGLLTEVISISSLINENARTQDGQLRVLFHDEIVKNFALVQFRIKNTGGYPISVRDFERDLKLKLENIDKVYSVKVTGRSPQNLTPTVEFENDSIIIKPLLLNPEDSFIINSGIDAENVEKLKMTPDGRISGIRHIKYKNYKPNKNEKDASIWFILSLVVSFISLIFAAIAPYLSKKLIAKEQYTDQLENKPNDLEVSWKKLGDQIDVSQAKRKSSTG
ncbi:MAG TPA: hypothetical protein VH858_17230 [Hyphomicrobiales bacterium]|jgi:hypothetical protein